MALLKVLYIIDRGLLLGICILKGLCQIKNIDL